MNTNDCLMLSKAIISINNNGYIASEFVGDISSIVETFDTKMELLNVILKTHRERYEQCYTDQMREEEIKRALSDYVLSFGKGFLDVDFIKDLIYFMFMSDLNSSTFVNICGNILKSIKTCDILEIKYTVYTRIMTSIIRCQLYGKQPFDGFLVECVDEVEKITKENANIKMIALMG